MRGGDNSAAQRELSTLLAGSVTAFAHEGNPTIPKVRAMAYGV